MKSIHVTCALVAFVVLTGCGSSSGDAADEPVAEGALHVEGVSPAPFTAKLYDEPRHQVHAGCDIFTKLAVEPSGQVTISNDLDGACEIMLAQDTRTYTLTKKSQDCGSLVYSGEAERDGVKSSIKITDNRGRTCENVIPALIVLAETRGTAGSKSYYGDLMPETDPPAGR